MSFFSLDPNAGDGPRGGLVRLLPQNFPQTLTHFSPFNPVLTVSSPRQHPWHLLGSPDTRHEIPVLSPSLPSLPVVVSLVPFLYGPAVLGRRSYSGSVKIVDCAMPRARYKFR
jgi:hypothetical protein